MSLDQSGGTDMVWSPTRARATAFIAALVAIFFFAAISQARAGTIAIPTSRGAGATIDGTTGGTPRHGFAGLIRATIAGAPAWLYCIDLNHSLKFNQPYEEGNWSAANVTNLPQITRILQQHPADATAAANDSVEAAAVQSAIWHFSDGFDLTGGPPGVTDLYAQIVADANLNPAIEPAASLAISPVQQTGVAGDYLDFTLTTSATGPVALTVSPAPGVELVTCDAGHTPIGSSTSGPYPIHLCLHQTTAGGPVTLTATATATVAAGRVFLRPESQNLVLADSRTAESSATATGTWNAAPPNQPPTVTLPCPTGGFVFGQSTTFTASGQDADNDALTYAWTNNGVPLASSGSSISVALQAGDVLTVIVSDSKGASSAPATLSASCGNTAPPPPTIPPTPLSTTPPSPTPTSTSLVAQTAAANAVAPATTPAPVVVATLPAPTVRAATKKTRPVHPRPTRKPTAGQLPAQKGKAVAKKKAGKKHAIKPARKHKARAPIALPHTL
jgi:hypothetical protein